MKKSVFFISSLLILFSAEAQEILNESHISKEIFFLPTKKLSIQYQEIGVEKKHWGRVLIELANDNSMFVAERNSIEQRSSQHRAKKINSRAIGKWRMTIPSLRFEETFEPKNDPQGPVFFFERYLSQIESEHFLANFKETEVLLIGDHIVDIPVVTLLEKKEYPPSICKKIAKRGDKLEDLLSKTILFLSQESFKHPQTAADLAKVLIERCSRIEENAAHDWDSFFKINVEASRPRTPIEVSLLKRSVRSEERAYSNFKVVGP